eukprot:6180221-Pleurochrysis_carterae.AAC.1
MRDEYLTSTNQGGDTTHSEINDEGDDDGSSYTLMPQCRCASLNSPVDSPLPYALPPPAGPNPLPALSPALAPVSAPEEYSQADTSSNSSTLGILHANFALPSYSAGASHADPCSSRGSHEDDGSDVSRELLFGGALTLLALVLCLWTAPAFARACRPRTAVRTQSLFMPTRRGQRRLRTIAIHEADIEPSLNVAHVGETQIQL